MTLTAYEHDYASALADFVRTGQSESGRAWAYMFGRDALGGELDLPSLVAMHAHTLAELVAAADNVEDAADIVIAGSEFLTEVVAPLEMILRGSRETNDQLRKLSSDLESQVEARTARLRESLDALRKADSARRALLARLVNAEEHERKRIAEDLHDDPIQLMTVAYMRTQLLRQQLSEGRERDAAEQAESLVQQAIVRLRRLVFELRPHALDHAGLAAAVHGYVSQFEHETGVATTFTSSLKGEPTQGVRFTLYRIALEALANVRRHAEAACVAVELDEREGTIVMTVRDDGRGFSPGVDDAPRAGHLGLTAIQERAVLAGGTARIVSSPGQGTAVVVEIPCEQAE